MMCKLMIVNRLPSVFTPFNENEGKGPLWSKKQATNQNCHSLMMQIVKLMMLMMMTMSMLRVTPKKMKTMIMLMVMMLKMIEIMMMLMLGIMTTIIIILLVIFTVVFIPSWSSSLSMASSWWNPASKHHCHLLHFDRRHHHPREVRLHHSAFCSSLHGHQQQPHGLPCLSLSPL